LNFKFYSRESTYVLGYIIILVDSFDEHRIVLN